MHFFTVNVIYVYKIFNVSTVYFTVNFWKPQLLLFTINVFDFEFIHTHTAVSNRLIQ